MPFGLHQTAIWALFFNEEIVRCHPGPLFFDKRLWFVLFLQF